MSILQRIKDRFFPIYELDSKVYFSSHLRSDDAAQLQKFLSDFQSSMSLPSAILAVGSTTYPLAFWDAKQNLSKQYPDLSIPTSYADIDLVVVPYEVVSLERLTNEVTDVLVANDLTYELHESTSLGVSYIPAALCNEDGTTIKIVAPYVNVERDLHSLETRLASGTKVDIILGRDDENKLTATQRIVAERYAHNSFSVLNENC